MGGAGMSGTEGNAQNFLIAGTALTWLYTFPSATSQSFFLSLEAFSIAAAEHNMTLDFNKDE
jgi:hypothetical protein